MEQVAPLIPLILLVVVFWFLVVRPARNRQRAMSTMQSDLSTSSVVMLTSGVFGQVVHLGDENVQLRIADDTVITVHRQAVGRLLDEEAVQQLRAEGSFGWLVS